MRISIWSLRPVIHPAQTRTFVESDQETGARVEFTLTLRRLSNPEQAQAFERGEYLCAVFLTGDAESGRPPMEFPSVGGRNVPITRTLLHNAAALEMMQAGEERYSAVELAALAAGLSAGAWREVLRFVRQIEGGAIPRSL